MFQINEESKKQFYEEFDRDEKSVEEDKDIIKNWMKTQPHLPEIMEDVKIKNFLNLNKFSIEKTKQRIDMYYTLRGLIPEIFTNTNPKLEVMQRAFDKMYFSTHPKALDGIHRIWFIKPKGPNMWSFEETLKLTYCIFEIRLHEDFMCDDVFIMDMSDITFNDMQKITLSLMAKGVAVYQKVYSLRLKNVHYLNCPPYINMLLSILKILYKPKLFHRIKAHQDSQVLNELFSKEDLPKDYGGDGPSLEELNEMMKRKLAEYQERFDVLDNLKVNESLRPEKLDNDEVLGYYGNFKKIHID